MAHSCTILDMALKKVKQITALAASQVDRPVKKVSSKVITSSPIVIDQRLHNPYPSSLELILRDFRYKGKTSMPKDIKPMLTTHIDKPFNDKNWQFEIKWDGYRTLAYVKAGDVELRSRNNLSFNAKYPSIVTALKQQSVNAILDGEIVVASEDGKIDFGALQNWHTKEEGKLIYYVFDLLWIEGLNLMDEPLKVRRDVLRKIFPENELIRYSHSIEECGIDFFAVAKKNQVEGIIAKQKDALYIPGVRSEMWCKIKAETRHEALICGYTKKKDSDRLISSLILGIPKNGTIQFIGQVGTGFNTRTLQDLFRKMNPLFTAKCPFPTKPRIIDPTMWVTPHLVCEVKYTALTRDGLMRHPSFQGLRQDKTASEINIEETAGRNIINDEHLDGNATLIKGGEESVSITLDNHDLNLTNLTKRYWPKEGITKGDLLDYYYEMAPFILPYLKDRPQSLNRFPNGITGKSFYQKDMRGKVAGWLKTFERFNEDSGEGKDFLICTGAASLLYMVNLGCIELNPWHSKASTPDHPDWCVIDLDPGSVSFEKVIQTAKVVHDVLESLSMPSFPKTSGSTGIHIYIPLGAKYSYEQSRQLAELIATLVHQELPSFTSLERSREKRKDKLYLDYLQNRPIQTICAPYSVRPRPGATVSAPLHWEEVTKGLKLSQYTIHSIPHRIKSEGDLFKGVLENSINLHKVLKTLSTKI